MRWAIFIVLAMVLLGFAVLLLRPGQSVVSPMIGQNVPAIELGLYQGEGDFFTLMAQEDHPVLVNIFGSWCPMCVVEHPVLMQLAAEGVPIYGIAWRDRKEGLAAFLTRYGNPYRTIGWDPQGKSIVALGVTGAPESFVVHDGVIQFHYAGPLTQEIVQNEILPFFIP